MTLSNPNPSQRFRINTPKVILETIDNEVVLVNLESGNYYSLVNAGAEIWGFIEQGATIGQTVEAVVQRYVGDRPALEKAVCQFISELQQEELLVPAREPQGGITPAASLSLAIHHPDGKLCFESAVLHKYTDMRELLLLDPIHEVDEKGWPSRSDPE